jgi:hypothetical protein
MYKHWFTSPSKKVCENLLSKVSIVNHCEAAWTIAYIVGIPLDSYLTKPIILAGDID